MSLEIKVKELYDDDRDHRTASYCGRPPTQCVPCVLQCEKSRRNKSEDPENIALLRMNYQKLLSEPILLSEHWRGII